MNGGSESQRHQQADGNNACGEEFFHSVGIDKKWNPINSQKFHFLNRDFSPHQVRVILAQVAIKPLSQPRVPAMR
jgi:hypothetical protein